MSRDDKRPQDEKEFDDSMLENGQYQDQAEGDLNEWPEQPVDDFADEPSAESRPEEIEPEDVTDEFQQLPEDDDAVREAAARDYTEKKAGEGKGSALGRYLPLAVGLVIIGGVGFFAWEQMSGMLAQRETANAVAAPEMGSTLPPPSQVAEATPPAPPAPAAESMPSDMPAPAEQAPIQAVAQPAPESAQPILQPAPAENALPPAAQPLPSAPPAPVPVAEAPVAAPAAASSELNRQLEEARASESQLRDQVHTLQTQLAAAPAADAVKALEEKVAMLEQQLATRRSAAAAATSSSASSSSSSQASSDASSSEAQAEAPRKSRAFKRASHGATAEVAPRRGSRSTDNDAARLQREVNARLRAASAGQAPVASPAPVAAAPEPVPPMAVEAPVEAPASWMLRSAQPGTAWISKGSSNNLRRVAVGDKVEGLGTITSVRQQAGRWLVEGTQGSLQ